MMEAAGTYSERVTIRRPAAPTNSGSVPVPGTPTSLFSRIPASVVSATAGLMEQVFGAQVQATATHVVTVRRREVLLTDEIVWHDSMRGTATDKVLRITGRSDSRENGETYLATVESIR